MSTSAWQHCRPRVQPRAHSDMWEIGQALHGHGDRPYALIYLKLWQGLLGLCTEPCSGMPFATIVAALPGTGRHTSPTHLSFVGPKLSRSVPSQTACGSWDCYEGQASSLCLQCERLLWMSMIGRSSEGPSLAGLHVSMGRLPSRRGGSTPCGAASAPGMPAAGAAAACRTTAAVEGGEQGAPTASAPRA